MYIVSRVLDAVVRPHAAEELQQVRSLIVCRFEFAHSEKSDPRLRRRLRQGIRWIRLADRCIERDQRVAPVEGSQGQNTENGRQRFWTPRKDRRGRWGPSWCQKYESASLRKVLRQWDELGRRGTWTQVETGRRLEGEGNHLYEDRVWTPVWVLLWSVPQLVLTPRHRNIPLLHQRSLFEHHKGPPHFSLEF